MSRVLFQPSIKYLSGNGPVGFFDVGAFTRSVESAANNFATGYAKGATQTTNTLMKWLDPDTSVALLDKGINAFKTVTGQGAQEQAQANLLALQQARAQAELSASAQFQQTIQAALPWVIGGGVLVVGAVLISKALK